MKEDAFHTKAAFEIKLNQCNINLKSINESNIKMKSNLRYSKKKLDKSMKNEEIMQLSKDAALELKKLQ